MKFNCDIFDDWFAERHKKGVQRRQAQWDRISVWHKHYAWFPVKVAHGDCRWLEHVERKINCSNSLVRTRYIQENIYIGAGYYFYWEYRLIK